MNKKIKKAIKLLIVPIILIVALNFELVIFNCNPFKQLRPDFTVEDVYTSDLSYLFDESNPINLKDIMDIGNLSLADALKVLINPDGYCFVSATLKITNNTGKDIYDEDWYVDLVGTPFCAVSVYETDSPLFSPVLNGEKSGKGISFIAPIDGTASDGIQSVPFSVRLRAADLKKAWSYDEFYGE